MRQLIRKIVKFLNGLWRSDMETDAPTTEEPIDEDAAFEKDQQDQMGQMEESIDDDALTHEEEPKTEAPATEEPVDEDEPKTDPPATEEPIDELADIKAEMAALKEEMEKAKEPKTEPPTTIEPIEEESFLSEDDDIVDIVNDPEKFNKLLNKVYLKGIETGTSRAKPDQSVVDSIPRIINENILEVASLEKVSRKFYEDNEDLLEHMKDVSEVFKELATKNPETDFVTILKDVEPEVRKRLNLTKPVKEIKDKETPPRLPGKKSQQRSSPKPKTESSSMLAELDEMDKSLGL
jgi:hypothetical protein